LALQKQSKAKQNKTKKANTTQNLWPHSRLTEIESVFYPVLSLTNPVYITQFVGTGNTYLE
jgi:hypothetical protein